MEKLAVRLKTVKFTRYSTGQTARRAGGEGGRGMGRLYADVGQRDGRGNNVVRAHRGRGNRGSFKWDIDDSSKTNGSKRGGRRTQTERACLALGRESGGAGCVFACVCV
jgi:hypothetical protein